MVDQKEDSWGMPLKIGLAAFLSAAGGAIFSSLITVPVQISEAESRLKVAVAQLEGKLELMRSVQIEIRDQQKINIAELARLSARLTTLEALAKRTDSGYSQPQRLGKHP